MFRALQTRNYRLYFFGQVVSLIGTWMQQVALSWLIYRLTNSEFLLGLTAFASQIPSLIVTPLAGALADRMNRHKLLIVAQVLAMIQAFLLAGLTLSGAIDVVDIILLGILLGVINALDMPTRQAFLLEMVEKRENLSNAIALQSSLKRAPALSMRDGTSKSPSRPRSRRNLAVSGSACTALGRPAVEPYTGSPTMALRRDGLAASPASPRLPRTTRLRFALRGAQRLKKTDMKVRYVIKAGAWV